MDKNELWRLYCEREKQVEKARNKRAIITVFVFASAFFLYTYFIERPTGAEIIGNALASIVLAGIYLVVNAVIFGQLYKVSDNERKMLEELKKRMDEAEH